MLTVPTHDLAPGGIVTLDGQRRLLGPAENHQTYCGLDCCVTLEVLHELRRTFNEVPQIYDFERALQGPYLEIMRRGFLTDEIARQHAARDLRGRIWALAIRLNLLSESIYGKPTNPNSTDQIQRLLYGAMQIPEVWISQKGKRRISTNREVLEKIADEYMLARPICEIILRIHDLRKQLEIMTTEIDHDNRFRASYNIAGTECISGDSLIWTKGGIRRIDEIYASSFATQVWNGRKFVKPVKKVKYENREGYVIVLENGYRIKCTRNHEMLTARGFVRAENLTMYDHIQLNVGLVELFGQHALPRGGLHEQLSEDFCEFYGMILADGCANYTNEHKRVRLANTNHIIQNRYIELAKRCFDVNSSVYGPETSFHSGPVTEFLRDLGFPCDAGLGIATKKEIPAELLRGKPNLLRALLRGLTLDSHITDKGLSYGTQSPVMQEQIHQILLALGIVATRLKCGNSTKLTIPRAYCGRFISMIGFVNPAKMEKLANILNSRCQWHEPKQHGQKYFVPITNILPWTGDVYDLTMPGNEPPQYIANGMTVHNSGRPSSSKNAFGTGRNAQNIDPNLRYVFVADPGRKLCVIDLEQVEARDVGYICGVLFDDWAYLDACEGGDLHTTNTIKTWPTELPWTGDPTKDKALASDTIFYREFSYRDMAKRGGHLTNYSGTAWTAARVLKVPIEIMTAFQKNYCRGSDGLGLGAAYPALPRYWQWCAQQLQTTHEITTPFGRRRHFFGRPGDDATVREAIAFTPQSTTADRMNLGLWRVWHKMPQIQLLAQGFDSITFQFRESDNELDIVAQALELIRVELKAPNGRSYVVPGEAKTGWNWGYREVNKKTGQVKNEEGLWKVTPGKNDNRVRKIGLQRTAF